MENMLYVPLVSGDISLEPLAEQHREELRVACAQDHEIWQIYPVCYLAAHFDPNFDLMINGPPQRCCYAIRAADEVVGMTAWLEDNPVFGSVEIGNSFIVPRLRGTGFNRRLKHLMLDHAFGCGYRRLVFKVDEINNRSQAALVKLGCVKEGVLRAEKPTWTGRIRNTVIFSILADEWPHC